MHFNGDRLDRESSIGARRRVADLLNLFVGEPA